MLGIVPWLGLEESLTPLARDWPANAIEISGDFFLLMRLSIQEKLDFKKCQWALFITFILDIFLDSLIFLLLLYGYNDLLAHHYR